MKKITLFIVVVLSSISCKQNNSKLESETNKPETETGTKFLADGNSCKKPNYLFDAVPHLDKIGDYNFESVGCSGTTIVVKYNHPTEKNYEFQTIIYYEATENKPMFNIATAGYGMTSVTKVNGCDSSDLKIFDNAMMTIKNSPDYFDVSYVATYKKDYTLMISIRGKDLPNKQKVDAFLKQYLQAFNLGVLK
jgi:hypothetical protein